MDNSAIIVRDKLSNVDHIIMRCTILVSLGWVVFGIMYIVLIIYTSIDTTPDTTAQKLLPISLWPTIGCFGAMFLCGLILFVKKGLESNKTEK